MHLKIFGNCCLLTHEEVILTSLEFQSKRVRIDFLKQQRIFLFLVRLVTGKKLFRISHCTCACFVSLFWYHKDLKKYFKTLLLKNCLNCLKTAELLEMLR